MAGKRVDGYTLVPYPVMRRFSIDGGHLGRRRHIIHGLLEIDVTVPRRILHDYKTGPENRCRLPLSSSPA